MFCGKCGCVTIHFLKSSIFSLDISGFFAYSSSAVIGVVDFSLIFMDSEKIKINRQLQIINFKTVIINI